MYNYDLLDDVAEYPLQLDTLTPYKNFVLWRERWEDELVRSRCTASTMRTYFFALDTFFDFVKRNRRVRIDKIGAKYINRYLLHYQIKLAEEKYAAGTLGRASLDELNREYRSKRLGKNDAGFTVLELFENTLSQRLTILKMFLKFIDENNRDQHSFGRVFDGITKIKVGEKLTNHLTVEEISKVVSYMHTWIIEYKRYKEKSSLRFAYRNALMVVLYALTGARSAEVVHIRLKDISESSRGNIDRYIIEIVKGKGGKPRTVWVHKEHIEPFLEYLRKELPSEEYYLSSTYRRKYTNTPLFQNHIRVFTNEILELLGIEKTGLHIFRRGYVTKRIGEDHVDVSIVAKEVGNTVAILERHYLKHNAEMFTR